MNELDTLVESARQSFVQALTPADLENAKAQFLGKAGRITELMKGMAALSVEEKKSRGAAINLAKQAIESALTERRQALADAELQTQLQAEALDVTLPGRQRGQGGLHPVSLTLERIEAIFGSMGFDVAQGPDGHDQHHKTHQMVWVDGAPWTQISIRGQWIKNQDNGCEQNHIIPFRGAHDVLGKIVHLFFGSQ
jgi:phenylalanyl-tRNA synthetase alpha subunit